jgi:hypothetical protein
MYETQRCNLDTELYHTGAHREHGAFFAQTKANLRELGDLREVEWYEEKEFVRPRVELEARSLSRMHGAHIEHGALFLKTGGSLRELGVLRASVLNPPCLPKPPCLSRN